ncbi:hypothetical protein GOV12_04000 [Candidatus Pacearchaeota archaeon]|nr:hypothetical protein [Candidatus Pacearchaeota archaeon]
MKRNQIRLKEKPLEVNRNFLKAFYNCSGLEGVSRSFDKLSDQGRRETDGDMTLDRFLEIMDHKFLINLQIGSPSHDQIRYCACSILKDNDIFIFVECSLNQANYDVVSGLYRKFYGEDIESVSIGE